MNINFYTITTETDSGIDFYKSYYTKRYAEKIYDREIEKLRQKHVNGCVTFHHNYDLIKEYVNV